MGSHNDWSQPDGFYLNGLLPDEAASVTRVLDLERWSIAEKRISELISRIQPNQPSEDRRIAVADYVQQLISKCFSCQVFTFGSVPLKTYLPDGDIDLTAFSKNQDIKETWAKEVRDMLENEEKIEKAEFCVKEVQYIQAEVKIIKCLVDNIVVDISFNQLGGLCTLCFLEEVDSLINQDHLFKRSIILIKAWCYYESRILGAHHGLISTYALETLVLYIFHVFNNKFAGPLEVLYCFLEFFSKFDWEHFCVSLWGPVPISSLPDVIADPPRRDGGDLLLSKVFLGACSSVYSVFPGGQETNELPFVSKHFNVIDPLRINNNLGRSVSKGNFFRIRSAFAFGAQRLARLLDCPKESIIAEVNQFFLNTWDRHGKGHRPDALDSALHGLQPINLNRVNGHNLKNSSSEKKVKEKCMGHESRLEPNRGSHASNGFLSQGSQLFKRSFRTINNMAEPQSQKTLANLTCSVASDHNHQKPLGRKSNLNLHVDNGSNCRPDSGYQFAMTDPSYELYDRCNKIPYQRRHNKESETIKEQSAVSRLDYSSKNFDLAASDENIAKSSREEPPSTRHISLVSSAVSSTSTTLQGDQTFAGDALQMDQEKQDMVNMMASLRVNGLPGHVQIPMNFASANLHAPLPPSVLASFGYANRNSGSMVPNGITPFEMPWATNADYSPGLASMPQFSVNMGMASHHQEETIEPTEDCFAYREAYHGDSDHGQWSAQNANFIRGHDCDDVNFHAPLEGKRPPSFGESAVSSATHLSPENYLRKGDESIKEGRDVRETYGDNPRNQSARRSEVCSPNRGSIPPVHAPSLRSRPSSEGSCDGSSLKSSKSVWERGDSKFVHSTEHSNVHKHGWQHESDCIDYVSAQTDDSGGEWIPQSTVESEVVDNMGPGNVARSLLQFHQTPSYESAELSGSFSVPVGSDPRLSNGAIPYAFYPAGPPVPFVTMLPFYNFPSEKGISGEPGSCLDLDEEFNEYHNSQSGQRLTENLQHFHKPNQCNTKGAPSSESSGENKSDILNGDLASHLQNLQYGRFCQSPYDQGSVFYPSPVVPPVYIQGHLPCDGPGKPLSANANLFTQLMGYGPGAVPVSAIQPGPGRPKSAYQSSSDEGPRYRGGTGTYLPNPNFSSRDRQSSKARNNRGNYSYDRKDHNAYRDPNLNINSKRVAGRGQGRYQVVRPSTRTDRSIANNSQVDRLVYLSTPNMLHSNDSQNGPVSYSNSCQGSNVEYGMYPVPIMSSSEVAPSATSVPSVFMFCPYDQNMGCDPPAEQQLKFGSIGPMHLSSVNEVVQLGGSSSRDVNKQRFFLVDSGRSSPDLPSSPMDQRGV